MRTPEKAAERRQHEFSSATKRQRFTEEKGCCQWCHEPITAGWRDRGPGAEATYHHITLVFEGGSKDPENCMVLHKKCHGGCKGVPLNKALHRGLPFDYSGVPTKETYAWELRYQQSHKRILEALAFTTNMRELRELTGFSRVTILEHLRRDKIVRPSQLIRGPRNTAKWTESDVLVQFKQSKSIAELLGKLGLSRSGGSFYLVKQVLEKYNLTFPSKASELTEEPKVCCVCGNQFMPSRQVSWKHLAKPKLPWCCSRVCVGKLSRNFTLYQT